MDVVTLVKNKVTGRNDDDFNATSHQIETGTDTLVVFDHDKNTSNIVDVLSVTDNEVKAVKHVVPKSDCEITAGPYGRVFFYRAPTKSIETTEHLADLEKSTVLSQITAYKPPDTSVKFNWHAVMLWFIVFVLIIVVAVK